LKFGGEDSERQRLGLSGKGGYGNIPNPHVQSPFSPRQLHAHAYFLYLNELHDTINFFWYNVNGIKSIMKAVSVILCSLASLMSLSNALIPPVELQQPLGANPDVISAPKNRPNIVFILSDDQDLQLDSISYMPFLNRHLGKQGTFYKNHFVPTAICCPARVTLWTGRYAHNTNVTDVRPPYGEVLFRT
jgi:hypothetical protein